jgi:hypothetical protein
MAAAANIWAKLDKNKLAGWQAKHTATAVQTHVAVVDMYNLPETVQVNGQTWRKSDPSASGTVSYWRVNDGDHFTVSPVRNNGHPTRRIENFHWTYYVGDRAYHYRFIIGSVSTGGTWNVTMTDRQGNFNHVFAYSNAVQQHVKVFVNALGYTCEVEQAVPLYANGGAQAAAQNAAAATPPTQAAATATTPST